MLRASPLNPLICLYYLNPTNTGAMRIPSNHFLLHRYIEHFGLSSNLFDFQMENFFIYMSGYEKTLTYEKFNKLLKGEGSKEDVDRLRALFPHLKSDEKNKTVDELFTEATNEVVKAWRSTYEAEKKNNGSEAFAIKKAYEVITKTYDKYTLRSYLVEHKNWSQDAINLFDLGNAHVVFENGFIESFKDAFLSSNKQGGQAGMQQLKQGMDAVPKAFISTDRGDASLIDNIVYGARVSAIEDLQPKDEVHIIPGKVRTHFTGLVGKPESIDSDYIILAIPYTSQRSISKNRSFVPKQEMAIRDVRYVEVTKVLLQYKTRWWEDAFEKGTGGKSPDGGLVSDLPIRYTMFPKRDGNPQFDHSKRGVIMAAYTFQQDATILGALSPERRIRLAAENLDRIYPEAKSLDLLEAGTSQVFPADELAGGSAFCYFGPTQKQDYLETMCRSDWEDRVFFAGEQASYTHGWIQGALEAGLRCAQQIWRTATVQPQ